MKLSISVMAHPSREQFFDYLRKRLDNPPFAIDQNNNLIENCKAAWRMHDPEAGFHAVIQDDAIVCENFKYMATGFIARMENQRITAGELPYAYNFFTIVSTQVKLSEYRGYSIEQRNRGGVAICLPVNQIESMLEFYDTLTDKHDDYRIGQWLLKMNFKTCYPIPCFIDHDDNNPSLCSHPKLMRRAYKYVDNM
jgi:hypothetical protein